ncbi:MAG: universal stress protein [Acidobacteriota bacterium]
MEREVTMVYRSICVAVALQRYLDFTPVALRQRSVARAMAIVNEATLTVISVDAPVDLLPHLATTEEKIQRFVDPLVEEGIAVHTILRTGKPSTEILEVIEEVEADVLIMGSHSKSGPLDIGLGSTVRALPHDLEVPLILIRPTERDVEKAQEMMIPSYPVVFPYG